MEYIKEFLVLFLLMTLFLYLVPGERIKRYIRFFTEIVLTVGILSPLLSIVFDSEKFLEKIEYETFTENLSEISKDMERMEFIQRDYYLEEYENAIEEDVKQTAQQTAEIYGYSVSSVKVHLKEEYKLESIQLFVTKAGQETIVIEEITWVEHGKEDSAMNRENGMTAEIRKKLTEYYALEEEFITVQYETSG